ncbi:MAG: hypothetical protein ACREPJ_14210, partial [Rhodanobacteraceae bacterium]
KLPSRPQPVPPIFQPEVAADAILYAASHRRRDVPVGAPTWVALWGQRLVPGLMDWYLGRTGESGQMSDEPETGARPDNLFEPVAGKHATHGRFDARAWSQSPALWVEKNRLPLALGAFALGLMGALAWHGARNGRS